MKWIYTEITRGPDPYLWELCLVSSKEEVIRRFKLFENYDRYEMSEIYPDGSEQVISGRGWTRHGTDLNSSKTLLKLIEENNYPDLPEDVLGHIIKEFDYPGSNG